MVKVVEQNRNHPLFATLSEHFDCQSDITHTTVRTRPKTRSDLPRSVLSDLGRHIFSHCVDLWNAKPQDEKQWWGEHAPPQFCTGFLWWTWSCLIKNYNGGPWTVKVSDVGGHSYIRPVGAPEGIYAKGYTGATEIGTLAHIDTEPGCPSEDLPLLLVHGWYPEAFDPADTWKVMAYELTGKDPTKVDDFQYVYDPEHPGDPAYALRYIDGEGRDLYVSNYTHDPGNGTPGDIRAYAQSLAREIKVLKDHLGAPYVDILTHSMGGLVARAYIENQDLIGNPYEVQFRHDVRGLIMMAPPNQGSHFHVLYPGWHDWTSVQQMQAGSDFLNQLNTGATGAAQGVQYHIIAGNKYDCQQWHLGGSSPSDPFAINWQGELVKPEFITYPPHAFRLCEYTNDEPNDSEVLVKETILDKQGGQVEVTPDRYYVYGLNHWTMRGYWGSPCQAATLVQLILANYTIEKWRAKGKQFEPSEANFIQQCFRKIQLTDAASEVYNWIMARNISIDFGDVPEGAVASWVPAENTIKVDPYAEGQPQKVVSQHIVHQGEHSRWKGENSINQEYHAFKAEADFWNSVKKGDADDHCDWVAGFIGQGKHAAHDYLRTLPAYADLPEYSGVSESIADAFTLVDDTYFGNPLCLNSQRMGARFDFQNYTHDAFAWYWLDFRHGAINTSWQSDPPQAVAAAIAYLLTRAAWDIQDSIHQEYQSFKAMARVWEILKGDLSHDFCDLVSAVINTTEAAAKDWIRSRPEYADLPEYFPPEA